LQPAPLLNFNVSLNDTMADLTVADMIWNRACSEDRLRALPGDRALADLLRAHGLTMNGGVLHAVECLSAEELTDAQAGYRYFGLAEIASLVARARKLFETGDDLERHERQLDGHYADLIPSDSSLVECFEKQLQANPSDFAPLRAKDMGRG
jgi:hypothetical protein